MGYVFHILFPDGLFHVPDGIPPIFRRRPVSHESHDEPSRHRGEHPGDQTCHLIRSDWLRCTAPSDVGL